ncbi:CIC11C00000000038 [Sungouiella intermedia]|uniref:CIC11C00000000038 n=1 Tax=Sungouiella intermedia TaxID=45354 RepID=A0A1L0DR30_9ASCO|nr:CIC11C00000000038 [[Candida] intermedia]
MSSESRPIQLSDFVVAIQDLSDENLLSLQRQLTTSTQKLKETNSLLEVEITHTKDEDELKLYKETIDENHVVLMSQQRRLDALEEELMSRGLSQKDEKGVYL